MRKTLLFDLDGTLLNTLEDLRDSTNFARGPMAIRSARWRRSGALSEMV